jgi:uracil-DNA glycosylase family 4
MLKSQPLVGESGQVFDECLHSAGIIRRLSSIANVSRVPIKDGSDYATDSGLTHKGLEARADLYKRIEGHTPKVIVALGNVAAACLCPDFGRNRTISKIRGSLYWNDTLKCKVIPTLHPASTLPGRGPYVNRYIIVADMKKAERESYFSEIRRLERMYLIRPTMGEALDFLQALHRTERVALDIEIFNLQVSCLGLCASPTVGMCIPFSLGDKHYWQEDQEIVLWKAISNLLADAKVEKLWQYGMFDESFLLRHNKIIVKGKRHDSLVMHRILYPDLPSKLEFICSMFSDIPYYKDDKKLWNRIKDAADTFFRYNINDVFSTWDGAEAMLPLIEADESYSWTYRNTMSLWDPCLFAMERGVKVDRDKMRVLQDSTRADIEKKEGEFKQACDMEINPASSKQVISYFYAHKGIPPYKNRKTHAPTCDDEALSRIVRKYNYPEARILQELRGLHKLRDAYLDMEFDPDGRLRCFYDIRGTTTGRLSSKKTIAGTGLNMQNLDPRFLSFIVPD